MNTQELIKFGNAALEAIRSTPSSFILSPDKRDEAIRENIINPFMAQLEILSRGLAAEERDALRMLCEIVFKQNSSDDFLEQLKKLQKEAHSAQRNLTDRIEVLHRYNPDYDLLGRAIVAFAFVITMALVTAIAITAIIPIIPIVPPVLIIAFFIAANLCLTSTSLYTGIRFGYQYIADLLENKQEIKKIKHKLTTETVCLRVLNKLSSEIEHTDTNIAITGAVSTHQSVFDESVLIKPVYCEVVPSDSPKPMIEIHPYSIFKQKQPNVEIHRNLTIQSMCL